MFKVSKYKIEEFIVAMTIGTFALNPIPLIFFLIIYIFIVKTQSVNLSKSLILLLSCIVVSGVGFSLYSIAIGQVPSEYNLVILLRLRFFLIRVLFALSILIYLSNLKKEQILKIIYLSTIPNTIIGFIQLIYLKGGRISMLSPEPSAAGFYYVFAVPLLIGYIKYNSKAKFWVYLYIILGLFIRSKAQILIFLFWGIYLLSRNLSKKKIIFIFLAVIPLGIISFPILMQLKEVNVIHRFFNVAFTQGLSGMNESNGIYTSYTTRLSGALIALKLFSENLLGIGFGVFHPMYISKMYSTGLVHLLDGIEVDLILRNRAYATPKGSFLELLVSCGLFFLIPLLWIFKRFLNKDVPIFLKLSFFGTLLVSFMVELSPLLVFIVFNCVILNKIKK